MLALLAVVLTVLIFPPLLLLGLGHLIMKRTGRAGQ